MNKLIWKYRYAKSMNKHTKAGWIFCWTMAGEALEGSSWEDLKHDPEACCLDELSYWEDCDE